MGLVIGACGLDAVVHCVFRSAVEQVSQPALGAETYVLTWSCDVVIGWPSPCPRPALWTRSNALWMWEKLFE